MKISVILPVYNASLYLKAAAFSILRQTYPDFELIAIDDGSTDSSGSMLVAFAEIDPRVKVISRPNTGIVGALNDGLAVAKGEYIARMDADDISAVDRFKKQIEHMNHHPDVVACGTAIYFTDPNGQKLKSYYPKTEHSEIYAELLEGNGGAMIHGSLLLRRDSLEEIGGYQECFRKIEDLDLFFRLAETGRLSNIAEPLYYYRQHPGSICKSKRSVEDVRNKIVNPYRLKHGLAELGLSDPDKKSVFSKADLYRDWAYDAAGSGFWETAYANVKIAICMEPWDVRNWKCWIYIKSAAHRAEKLNDRKS